MDEATGFVVEYDGGDHEYFCEECWNEEIGNKFVVNYRVLEEGDRREEAFCCSSCDLLLLAGFSTAEENA